MREIKFRAWVDSFQYKNGERNKVMIYSGELWYPSTEITPIDPITVTNYGIYYTHRRSNKNIIEASVNGEKYDFYNSWDYLEIYDKDIAIMQYTGLKDKNGKEIYEGDIIQAGDDVFKILYSNNDFCHVFWLNSQKNYMTLPFLKGIKDFEMIGNIYENPELLEASHDT